MLGRFLEFTLHTGEIGVVWQRWLSLGFAAAETGDAWRHPYGVVASEGLAIGLHATVGEPLCISLVRSGVAELERALSQRLIGMERVQLGADAFHLLELREPGGVLLRVLEARTFSAPPEPPHATALGRFRMLSLPCADLAEARGFWERLDIDLHDITDPWEGFALRALPIACHEDTLLAEPVLVFDEISEDLDDEVLRTAVFGSARTLPALRPRRHRLLRAPEKIALLLLGPAD